MMSSTLLTPDDVATWLRIPKKSVYALVEARRIPFVRLGRLIRFDQREMLDWLSQRRVSARKGRNE